MAGEEQNEAKLSALAASLSDRLSEYVASVLVHDSDILHVDLFNHGQRLNTYRSLPGQATINSGDGWGPLVSDAALLEKAFKHRTTFAEDTLEKIAEVVAFDKVCVSRGYKYATEDEDWQDGLRIKNLLFRSDGPAKPKLKADICSYKNVSEPNALVQLTANIKNEGANNSILLSLP